MSAELIAQIRATHIDGHAETCGCGQLGLCSTDWEDMPCSALQMADELEAAQAKLQAIAELHRPISPPPLYTTAWHIGADATCSTCIHVEPWPCATVRAAGVDGEPA